MKALKPEFSRVETRDTTIGWESYGKKDSLRVVREELVDSVIVDANIYNPGCTHLGAFPDTLLDANHQFRSSDYEIEGKIYAEYFS